MIEPNMIKQSMYESIVKLSQLCILSVAYRILATLTMNCDEIEVRFAGLHWVGQTIPDP